MIDRLVDATTLLLAAAAAAVILGFLISAVSRSPFVALALLGLVTLTQWEYPNPPPLASLAGSSIYANDILAVTLVVAVILAKNHSTSKYSNIFPTVAIIAALATISLLRGFSIVGSGTATTEARGMFWILATLIWTIHIDWSTEARRQDFEKASLWLGWALSALAGYHVVRYGLGAADTFVDPSSGLEQTGRPLVAGQALVLALCLFVQIASRRDSSTSALQRLTPYIFLAVIVASQQRTAWLAAATGLLMFATLGNFAERLALAKLSVPALLGAIAISLYAAGSSLAADLYASFTNRGTYQGRTASWQALMSQFWENDLFTKSVGLPFGSGFGRYEGAGRYVTFAPHNWYVYTVLRTGLLGLAAMILLIIRPAVRAIIERQTLSLAILGSIAIFGWAYSWPWYAMPFLGLAMQRKHDIQPTMITKARLPRPANRTAGRLSDL